MDTPAFDAPILADLAAAFARRGRAIRYRGPLAVAREVAACPPSDERLNVDFDARSRNGLRLRLSAWPSGDWLVIACQRRPGRVGGWLFEHEVRGTLGADAAAVVCAFESSLTLGAVAPAARLGHLRTTWAAIT